MQEKGKDESIKKGKEMRGDDKREMREKFEEERGNIKGKQEKSVTHLAGNVRAAALQLRRTSLLQKEIIQALFTSTSS